MNTQRQLCRYNFEQIIFHCKFYTDYHQIKYLLIEKSAMTSDGLCLCVGKSL